MPVPKKDQPTLDVIEAKVRPPPLRPGVISRTALVNGLRREAPPLVSVTAPAGYGKTTLLAEWAAAESRAVAWLSIDSHDNDPPTLMKHLLAAIDGGRDVHPRLLRSLAADPMHDWRVVFDEVTKTFRSLRRAFLFVLDNVDLLRVGDARRMLLAIVTMLPEESTTVLASRAPSKLPAHRLRARGPMRHIGIEELMLGDRDARLLLESANPGLSEPEASQIIAACEGWPTGLYLGALAAGNETTRRADGLDGNDRYLADYIRAEFLSQLSAKDISFLRRTAILDELRGPLCDAVLHDDGSAQALTRLSHASFVVPLDGKRGSYRVPGLVRDVLARELLVEEPRLVPVLHRSAANWYESRGKSELALEHAQNAGDPKRVAAIITATALPVACSGRAHKIERALAAFEQRWPLERYPGVAVHGSRLHAFRGRSAEAEQWLAIAERAARRGGADAAALRPRIAIVRAALCRRGPRHMLADARLAVARLPRSSQWYPIALHMHACAALLLGATDEADALLGEVGAVAGSAGYSQTQMVALSQLSLLARERGDALRADGLASEALELVTVLDGDPTCVVAFAAAAHVSLRHGRWAEAREHVTAAEPLAPLVTDALPWFAVATRLELARCYLGLRDTDAAHAVLAETEGLLREQPLLGVLVDQARELREEISTVTQRDDAPAGLTPAELRLLPLLATHLSFREIADELRVSRNTVKTQAISMYRKLGVSGRSEAITTVAGLRLEVQAGV